MSEPLTLAEIGALLGMSGERVRQIERRALRKLRALLEERERGGGGNGPGNLECSSRPRRANR